MQSESASPVIGISSTVLEEAASGARLDGIGTYTRELESALISQGVDVRRVAAPSRVGVRLVRPRAAALSFPVPLSYSIAAATILRLRFPFSTAVERSIDLYHSTDYMIPRLRGKPVVATVYDAIPLAHPEWANQRLRPLKNWLLRRCAQSADLVVAISEAAVGELMEQYHLPRARIRVVPLGVNASWFERPQEIEIRRILERHRLQRGYLLNVGTLQPRKNLDRLISAYEALPRSIRTEQQLVLVGKYGWGVESLRTRLKALRPAGRVVWLDYVEHDELRAIYHGAGLFVYPSLAEGFGLPVLEALACGLPVLASDIASLREVASEEARFVAPEQTEAITEAIAQIHQQSDVPGAAARRRDRARRFTWTACGAATLRVYRELIPTR